MLDFLCKRAGGKRIFSAGFVFLFLAILNSCGEKSEKTEKTGFSKRLTESSGSAKRQSLSKATELNEKGLVPANQFNKNILINLKYATTDNFMHRILYDTLKTAYLQVSAAKKLAKIQSYLSELQPGYRLLVYDALRPQSVQFEMWEALDTIPVGERTKFVSNPYNGSVHNYAAAVDLTIVDERGKPLDMGAGYDDIRKIAYPELEAHFLSTGELKNFQVENRKLLRKVMKSEGFSNIPTEWWHFNEFSRAVVKQRYKIVKTENI